MARFNTKAELVKVRLSLSNGGRLVMDSHRLEYTPKHKRKPVRLTWVAFHELLVRKDE
jgi:hypothetical protein